MRLSDSNSKKNYKLKYFWETYATNATIFCAQKLYNRGEIVCFFLYLKCLLKTHEFILIAFFTILLIFSQNLADLWDDRFLIDQNLLKRLKICPANNFVRLKFCPIIVYRNTWLGNIIIIFIIEQICWN